MRKPINFSVYGTIVSFALFFLCISLSSLHAQTGCNPYIEQLSNGKVRFKVSLTGQQAYVEVFSTANGLQNIATNIKASEVNNNDGTYTYSYEAPASMYTTGTEIKARFYAYMTNKPGVFVPGPSEGVWSPPFFYNQGSCISSGCVYPDVPAMSLEILTNGSVKFSVTYPKAQAYVEVFVKKNSTQIIATNIVSSVVNNANGTLTYSYLANASSFAIGDMLTYRFYAYEAGKPGTFLPGPLEGTWSQSVSYAACVKAVYVSTNGSDANPGTITAPVATVFKGLSLAQQVGANEVRVAEGTYSWDVTPTSGGSLTLVNGINLKGAYSADFSSQNLDTSHLSTLTIKYIGQPFYFKYWAPAIVVAANITSPTVFEGFEVTGGFSTYDGSGMTISNTNNNFIVRHNNISGNGYQISCPWVCGGNISLTNSSAQLHNNIVINGYRKNNVGNDLLVVSGYSDGTKSDIHDNLFTCNTSVSGASLANFHHNSYLMSCSGTISRISIFENEVVVHDTEEPVTVEVYSLAGQLLLKETTTHLSLEGLKAGAYMVALTTEGGTTETSMVFVK